MSELACRRLRIHGLVQGVGFRYALEREARRLGLAGWVRNRRDGTVEAVVQGHAPAVEALVAWAHRGPPSARVARVEVTEDGGGFTDFGVLPNE
ncbi:MAG: acylphosphatase [Burkholderiales bacterium]